MHFFAEFLTFRGDPWGSGSASAPKTIRLLPKTTSLEPPLGDLWNQHLGPTFDLGKSIGIGRTIWGKTNNYWENLLFTQFGIVHPIGKSIGSKKNWVNMELEATIFQRLWLVLLVNFMAETMAFYPVHIFWGIRFWCFLNRIPGKLYVCANLHMYHIYYICMYIHIYMYKNWERYNVRPQK